MPEQIKMVKKDPTKLTPYERNTKKHPPEQVAKIVRSITEFGFDQPIVVDGEGVIIKGHGRHQAALEMGLSKVPVVVRDDLTAEQARLSRIADNRSAVSDFDLDSLKLEVLDFQELGLDLNLTGLEEIELLQLTDPSDLPLESTSRDLNNAGSPVIQYTVIFTDEADQQDFFRLLKKLRQDYPERTIGEAFADYSRDVCDAEA